MPRNKETILIACAEQLRGITDHRAGEQWITCPICKDTYCTWRHALNNICPLCELKQYEKENNTLW